METTDKESGISFSLIYNNSVLPSNPIIVFLSSKHPKDMNVHLHSLFLNLAYRDFVDASAVAADNFKRVRTVLLYVGKLILWKCL